MAEGGTCSHQLDLGRASHRLKTYVGWPTGTAQRPEKLAAEGFVFTGKQDTVQCHYCGITLYGWKATWDPAHVHSQRTAGKCWFANKRMENRMNSSLAYSSFYAESMERKSGLLSVVYSRPRPTKTSIKDVSDARVPGHISYDKNKKTLGGRGLVQREYLSDKVTLNGISHKLDEQQANNQRVPDHGESYLSFNNTIPQTDFKEDTEDRKSLGKGVDQKQKLGQKSTQVITVEKRNTEDLASHPYTSASDGGNLHFDYARTRDDFDEPSRRPLLINTYGSSRQLAPVGHFAETRQSHVEAAKQTRHQGTSSGENDTQKKSDEVVLSPRKEGESQGAEVKKKCEETDPESEAIHEDQVSAHPEINCYNFVEVEDVNASALLVMIDQGYYPFQRDSNIPMKHYVNAAMDMAVVFLVKAKFSSSLVRKVILEGLEKGEEYYTSVKRLVEEIHAYLDAQDSELH